MKQRSHTPTPWALYEGKKGFLGQAESEMTPFLGIERVMKNPTDRVLTLAGAWPGKYSESEKADADFMVHAANCHDDMVKALTAVYATSMPYKEGMDVLRGLGYNRTNHVNGVDFAASLVFAALTKAEALPILDPAGAR